MGNATKVALVALLILLVVVVARFVREDSTPEKDVADGGPASAKNLPGKVPARNSHDPARSSHDPARAAPGTSVAAGKGDLATRGRQAATIPAVARNPAPAAPAPAGAAAPAPALRSGGPDGTGARTVFSPIDPSTTGVSTGPGSTPGSSGADAGVVQPRTVATAPLPAPNPLSLDGPGGSTVRRLEFSPGALPGAKSQEGHPTDPAPSALVQTRLGESSDPARNPHDSARNPHDPARGSQDPGPATTPGSFRALAESGREAQGPGVRDSVRPTPGVAREPTRPERSSATDASETFHDARGYPKTHEVVKGDSFWGLADRHYGDGRLAPFLEKENGGKKLRPGMKVTIPAPPGDYRPPARVATAPGTSRDPAPARPAAPGTPTILPRGDRDYVVQKGDTLSLIARKFYGDPAKFHLLEEANPDLKYQMLQAGARIKVPRKE